MFGAPQVSVITITRNDVGGLKRTIESVRAQSYSEIEHVVVDGASTDESNKLLLAYSADCPEAVVISEPDNGIYDAMNKGVRLASGELIVFMNSGDIFTRRDTVESVVRSWTQLHWEWAYGGVRFVDESGAARSAYIHAPFSKRRFFLALRYIPHQATYMERRLIETIGGFSEDFGVSGDQELAFRAALAADPHVFVDLLADFLVGGAHSKSGDLARERRWHRMRTKNGVAILRCSLIDSVYTVILGAFRASRKHLVRAVRAKWG